MGQSIACLIKNTTTNQDQALKLWQLIKEKDCVTKYLPSTLSPGIMLTELILGWNNALNNRKRVETLSMFVNSFRRVVLKKFNTNSKETNLPITVSKNVRFNPPVSDWLITKAKLHR